MTAISAITVLSLHGTVAGAGAVPPQLRVLDGCVPKHSHLIAAGTRGQVFFAPEPGEGGAEAVYGCAYGRKHSYLLGKPTDCGSHGCVALERETIAGTFVAYEESLSGGVGSSEFSYLVLVRDLRNGRILHRLPTGVPASNNPELVGDGMTTAIALKSDGAVAWILESGVEPSEYQVHADDKKGNRVLATGANISPHSLALAGSTLYWTQGGKPFSATLTERTIVNDMKWMAMTAISAISVLSSHGTAVGAARRERRH